MPDRLVLQGESTPQRIGDTRVSFAAPGLVGELTLEEKGAGATERLRTGSGVRDSSRALSNDEIDQAIEEVAGLESYNLETDAATPVAASTDETTRGGPGPIQDDEAVVEYEPNPGEYSYVIYRDEAGVISLHFPENLPEVESKTGTVKTTRGPGETQRYRIVLRKPPPSPQLPPGEAQTRFGIITVGKKLIKLVVGKTIKKMTAPLMEAADYGAVWLWESRARALQGFHNGKTAEILLDEDAAPMTDADWKILDGGGKKSLLFIHGTTSTTSGAFGGLYGFPAVAKTLYDLYDNRVLGFNHHTLTLSVADNVADFYTQLPAGGTFHFDVVCHSRGGLLARALKELAVADVAKLTKKRCACSANVSIGKIVFVGTPNTGTHLADPKDIPHALEVLSNVASLIPGAGLTLAGIFSGAAFVAENGFKALPGLCSMNPSGDFLKQLNAITPSGSSSPIRDYSAIQSSFSSTHLVNKVLLRGLKLLFKGDLNDLIVPTLGTSNIDGKPLADEVIMYYGKAPRVESIAHTQYFKHAETWEFIKQCLTASGGKDI